MICDELTSVFDALGTWFALSLVSFSKEMVLHAGVSFASKFERVVDESDVCLADH